MIAMMKAVAVTMKMMPIATEPVAVVLNCCRLAGARGSATLETKSSLIMAGASSPPIDTTRVAGVKM